MNTEAQVDREQLEASLEELRRRVSEPRHGIHGPGTIAWEVGRENVLFLGGGRAALLQLAHPAVASAIAQHSQTRQDVWGRFWRTFRNVWAMSFGDLDAAQAAARRVHAIHCRVYGQLEPATGDGPATAYSANRAEALLWVYATLVDTSLQVFQLAVRPLSRAERDCFVEESQSFGLLFGIPRTVLPSDSRELTRYMTSQLESEQIAAWLPARRMCDFLMQPLFWGMGPLSSWYQTMTAGLLPPRLREGFGFRFEQRERQRFERWLERVRRLLPYLPGRLRYVPAYHTALRRSRRGARSSRHSS